MPKLNLQGEEYNTYDTSTLRFSKDDVDNMISIIDAKVNHEMNKYPCEVMCLRNAHKKEKYKIMILLCWTLALRTIEVRHLQVKDLFVRNGMLICLIRRFKGSKVAGCKFPFQRLVVECKEGYLYDTLYKTVSQFVQKYSLKPDDYFASVRLGSTDILSEGRVRHFLTDILVTLGIKGDARNKFIGWHGFRRGRVSRSMEDNIPLNEIQHLLRHAEVVTTQGYADGIHGRTYHANIDSKF